VSLETYNFAGRLYRHPKAQGLRWSSYYGAQGGGFGSLSWSENRSVNRDYPDLGFRYQVKLRKGLRTILFHGFIVNIEQVQGDADTIEITALGYSTVFADDVFNKIYVDARPGEWTGSETASGILQPDKFDYDKNDRLYFKPRRGIDFELYDYTMLRYDFPFGETPEWISFDYDVALPNTWPGIFGVSDDVTGALWTKTVTASGSEVLTITAGATYVEVYFQLSVAGENTAEDDTVYGKLTNVRISSCSEATITITEVFTDLVEYLEDHGLSSDLSRIASIDKALPDTVAFETDQTPQQIMEWCSQFGGEDNALLAWGIELNDEARAYLEVQDLTTIKYYVRRSSGLSAQVRGDLKTSRQKTYVIYKDDNQATQRTADMEDADQIAALGGFYRREAYQANGNVDAVAAASLAALVLAEHSAPQVTTSFTVTDHVYSAAGKRVPIEEIKAGGIVVVSDFRAREITQDANDYRTQWSSFQLVGVEIDYEQNSARLIPAGDRRAFEQILAKLAQYG
jgi:hypothetical protein